ncbi:hypothetical protein KEM56_000604 [Ascosphaera pollenicola]|nr:hypothetical protein KEM56_000604 [Ascosphaera pollenicola]
MQNPFGSSVNSKKRPSISSVQSQAHKKPRLHPLRQTSFPDVEARPRAAVTGSVRNDTADGASVTGSFTGSLAGSQWGKKRKLKKDRDGTASVKGGGDGGKSTKGGAGSVVEDPEDDGEAGNDEEEDIEDDVDLLAKDEDAASDSEAEKKNLAILIDAFTPEQSSRYDFFKRAKLNKPMVRKIVNQTLSQSVPPNVITTISGYTKVFVGELIERARTVQEEWAEIEDRNSIEQTKRKKAEAPEKQASEDADVNMAESGEDTAQANGKDTQETSTSQPTEQVATADQPQKPDYNPASDEAADEAADEEAIPQYELPPNPHRGPLLPQHIREALRRYKNDGEGGGVGFSGLSMGALGVKGSHVWGRGGGGGRRLFR